MAQNQTLFEIMVAGYEVLFAEMTYNQMKLFSPEYHENMFPGDIFDRKFDFLRVSHYYHTSSQESCPKYHLID